MTTQDQIILVLTLLGVAQILGCTLFYAGKKIIDKQKQDCADFLEIVKYYRKEVKDIERSVEIHRGVLIDLTAKPKKKKAKAK